MPVKKSIDDFDQKYRDTLESGINLLRYGLDEDGIEEFMDAVRKDPELASFINKRMNIWGSGHEYTDKKEIYYTENGQMKIRHEEWGEG